MSYLKGNNDQILKGKIYQTKTVSDKNLPTSNNDLTLTLYLNKLIDQYQIRELENFISQEKPSSSILENGISLSLKKYNLGDKNFYKLLDILFQAGASPDISINTNSKDNPKLPNIQEKENITLLMLGIRLDDIELINTVLKYSPNINKCDSLGRNAIIYSILYNQNDSTDILNILIKNKADIDFDLKIQVAPNQYEQHSVFTLACYKDLPRVVKCLIDNYVNVNYKIKPEYDTGLHICAKYGRENTLKVLLSCERINLDITNKNGKRAIELVPDNEKRNEIMKIFSNYNNKMNMNNNYNKGFNNPSNFNYQQMNAYNQQTMNNVNYMNSMGNNTKINNINNNINNIDNYKAYINNVNSMNSNQSINNNSEKKSQKQNNSIENNHIFNDSSDFSDENELKEKQINKNLNKNNNFSNSIKLLNQNAYNHLLSKANQNFNIEIPIEIIKKKNHFSEKFNTLNNFMMQKINSTPLLNLDITDKCFDLELKLNELKAQLAEKNKKLNEYSNKIAEKDKIIDNDKKKLKEKNIDFQFIKSEIIENNHRKEEYNKIKQELNNQLSQDKLFQQSNKYIESYKELKFSPHQIEDVEMFKILNKDLMDYQKYITHKINKKIPSIKHLINDIKVTINSATQDYDVHVYGSYANGLCMPWSDLDLVLVNKNENANNANPENNNNENNDENILLEQNNNLEMQSDSYSVANTDSTRETNNQLNQNNLIVFLYQRLKMRPWVKQIIFTENLSVKILRIITTETFSEINIDISIDCEKHNGLKCVELVKSYLKEYTCLKPITLALKAILQSANLHNPNKGGLSSYGLILMVVSYIQSQKDYFGLKNEQYLCGKIFYGFLKHYGILFDFNKYLILTYPLNETNYVNTDKESFLNINQFSQDFIILDPLNNKNNVANSSSQCMNLKMAFMIAFMVTKEDCDCGCHYGKFSNVNTFNSMEHCYLKRMLNSVRRFQG